MIKIIRSSTRPFSRDWLFELLDYTKSAMHNRPAIAVRNAWIPEPPRWVRWLNSIRLMYVNRVLAVQGCAGYALALTVKRRIDTRKVTYSENSNKFQRSIANVSIPRGTRRAEFEAGMRRKIEGYLRRDALGFTVRFYDGLSVLLVMISSVGAAAACARVTPSTAATAAVLSIFIVLIIGLITQFLLAVKLKFIGSFVAALYISVGSWAGVEIFTRAGIASYNFWRAVLLFLLFGLGAQTAIGLLIASISTISQRLYYVRGGLDNYLLAFLLDLHHLITFHKQEWGEVKFQHNVSYDLSMIADLIETYLPGRLAANGGRGRRERNVISNEIGQGVRYHFDDVMRADGRDKLRRIANSYITLIYRGALLELPREKQKSRLGAVVQLARPLVASLIPAALMLCLRATKIVVGSYETYGWLFAALWFAVSFGTWIDPGLAERMKIMNNMIAVFKGQGESSDLDILFVG